MSTLEKTINLLNLLPENQVEMIYSYAQFLRLQQRTDNVVSNESIDDILRSIIGIIPDAGMSLEEYRQERRNERYGIID